MIIGIGIDIVEIDRIHNVLKRQRRFVDRILTEKEKRNYSQLPINKRAEHLAGRFAAKEAFAKAYGTGIGESLSFQDIEIERASSGKPKLSSSKLSQETNVFLSISHSKQYAVANVILENREISS